MPVTNYHTLNGELLGETGPGGRRFYGKDALGSVVATYDQNGTLENTYRYKPYGGLLSKTGSAPDPRFMWTGSTGSRTTGASYAEQYDLLLHYGTRQASMISLPTVTRNSTLTNPASLHFASNGIVGHPVPLGVYSGDNPSLRGKTHILALGEPGKLPNPCRSTYEYGVVFQNPITSPAPGRSQVSSIVQRARVTGTISTDCRSDRPISKDQYEAWDYLSGNWQRPAGPRAPHMAADLFSVFIGDGVNTRFSLEFSSELVYAVPFSAIKGGFKYDEHHGVLAMPLKPGLPRGFPQFKDKRFFRVQMSCCSGQASLLRWEAWYESNGRRLFAEKGEI